MFVYKLVNYEPGQMFAWPLAIITEHLEALSQRRDIVGLEARIPDFWSQLCPVPGSP